MDIQDRGTCLRYIYITCQYIYVRHFLGAGIQCGRVGEHTWGLTVLDSMGAAPAIFFISFGRKLYTHEAMQ
jgi:hypothetical protein